MLSLKIPEKAYSNPTKIPQCQTLRSSAPWLSGSVSPSSPWLTFLRLNSARPPKITRSTERTLVKGNMPGVKSMGQWVNAHHPIPQRWDIRLTIVIHPLRTGTAQVETVEGCQKYRSNKTA